MTWVLKTTPKVKKAVQEIVNTHAGPDCPVEYRIAARMIAEVFDCKIRLEDA